MKQEALTAEYTFGHDNATRHTAYNNMTKPHQSTWRHDDRTEPEQPENYQPTAFEKYEGETIELRVEKILTQGAPIKDGAPQIYTERADGVPAEYNVRTDRFEEALDMTDEIAKRRLKERTTRLEAKKTKNTDATDHPTTDTLQ